MKKVLAVIAFAVLVLCISSLVFAVGTGPIYDDLLAVESLAEFRAMLLAEQNRSKVNELSYEEIMTLTGRVEYLYGCIVDPSADDTETRDEMVETLSILPNGPEELYGNPTTLLTADNLADGETITSDTTVILDKSIELKNEIKINPGITLTIVNQSKNTYTISRADNYTGRFFWIDSNESGGTAANLIINNTGGGRIVLDGESVESATPLINSWGGISCTNVDFKNCINKGLWYDTYGGAISLRYPIGKTHSFTNCTFTNCQGKNGGAISLESGHDYDITLSGCTFTGCKSTELGGAISINGTSTTLRVSGCTFRENTGGTNGGAIYLAPHSSTDDTYSISNSTFTSNSVSGSASPGGGALTMNGHGTITGCTFDGNSVPNGASHAGSIRLDPVRGSITVSNTVIKNSIGGNGSAIYVQGTSNQTVYLTDSLVYNCQYSGHGDGGTIRSQGGGLAKLVVEGCVIRNNSSIRGGAFYWNAMGGSGEDGKLTIRDSQLLNNSAILYGGAIFSEARNIEITGTGAVSNALTTLTTAPGSSAVVGTRVQGNYTTDTGLDEKKDQKGIGGAICIATLGGGGNSFPQGENKITLGSNVLITENTADYGGAVGYKLGATDSAQRFVAGHKFTVDVAGATIQNNTANNYGGAFYMTTYTTVAVVPTVNVSSGSITSNKATQGGVFYAKCGNINITGGTISANKIETGLGGVFFTEGTGACGSTPVITMSDGTISGNIAERGAAGYLKSGSFTMTGGQIGASGAANTASINGGAFYLYGGNFTMSGGNVQHNTAGTSGGAFLVHTGSTLEVTGSATINNNTANNGGGVCVSDGSFTFSGGTISNNTASAYGGGIKIENGTVTIGLSSCKGTNASHNCPILRQNNVSKNTALGAGIAVVNGTVDIYCCYLVHNATDYYATETSSSYFQSDGEVTWYGGDLSIGHWKTGGTLTTGDANVDLHTVIYDLYDPSDPTAKASTQDNLPNGSTWPSMHMQQFVRGNSLTLPAGTVEVMNSARYRQNQNGGDWAGGISYGRICMGWATSEDKAAVSNYMPVGDSYPLPSDSVMLYAVWKNKEYEINYECGDGATLGTRSPGSYVVTPGQANASSITISNPTKPGYTFAGWTASGGNWTDLGTDETVLTGGKYGNVTLTAKWTKNTYYVHYDGNGATGGSMSNSTHTYDTDKTLTANAFVKEYAVTYNYNNGSGSPASAIAAYTFNGWKHGSNIYADKATVKNLTTDAGATVTLTAQWNGGAITLPEATRVGYTLAGWYTASTGGTKIGNAGESYNPTSNITLYARWTPNTDTRFVVKHFQMDLNGNYPAEATETQELQGTTDATLLLEDLARNYEGFTYAEGRVDGNVTIRTTVLPDGSRVISLYYTRNQYSVTLIKGENVTGVTGAQSYYYGVSVTISATGFNDGYEWNNWTGYATSTNMSYTFTMPAQNVTFTAEAKPITYTITFKVEGVVKGTKTYTITDAAFELGDADRASYKFLCWQVTTADGNWTLNDQIKADDSLSGKWGNVTLTAVWEVATADLTVTVTGVDAEQSVVFSITGTRKDQETFETLVFSIVGNGSVTINELPAGDYTIRVLNNWSWRYGQQGERTGEFNANRTESFDFSQTNNQWLNDYDAE